MRLILGLDRPTAGTVTVNGKPFGRLAGPMGQVGALLDAKALHGAGALTTTCCCLAQTNNLPSRRVDEVLALVGLTEAARKRPPRPDIPLDSVVIFLAAARTPEEGH
jgi:ABC-2 type transport system ATP-binding protein